MLVFSFRGIPADVWRARYGTRPTQPTRRPEPVSTEPVRAGTAAVVHAGLARAA
jgi:hypothetical protein